MASGKNANLTIGVDPHTKKFGVGVDIGGTKIRVVLWDGKRVLKAREFRTPKKLTAFKKLLGNVLKSYHAMQVGIGAPCVIAGNKIMFCPNIKYLQNYDISKLFKNAKIKLDNDARCFARAECPKSTSCLAITLGTGIGRAYGKSGKILKINKFEYPESWERKYQKLRDAKNDKKLSDFLTEKISILIKKYKPRVVVIGGGVATRNGLKLGFPYKKPKLGTNAAAIGAAMLFTSASRRKA